MLPTFIIGLREGLEAALIVGIIAAFLTQRGARGGLRPMWAGVAAAIGLSVAVAVVLQVIGRTLPHKQQEGLETVLALLAVGGVTYMVVWMRRHSRELKSRLERGTEAALVGGSTAALAGMAFFGVLREGLETSVFLLAAFQGSRTPAASGFGAVLGVAVAVVLGWGIYRGGLRIDLGRFFRVTGIVLVLVAAGLLASSAHTAYEAGWLTILQAPAVDLTWLAAPGSVRSAILTGMLGLQPVPTVAELLVWFAYAIPMGFYVLWPHRPASRQPLPWLGPALERAT